MLLPTTDLTADVAPPPELLTSSNLEEFYGCSKASALIPPVSPTILGLAFVLEDVNSYDLFGSLRPSIPKESVTLWKF
jgi:hypothetical protein